MRLATDFVVWLTSLTNVNKSSDLNLSIRPIAGALGAEIQGVNLADASGRVIDDLREAFNRYHVLVFREQELSPAEQKHFAQHFGCLETHPYITGLEDHPEVVAVSGINGHWAKGLPVARGRGLHFNSLVSLDLDNVDKLSSAFDSKVKVRVARTSGAASGPRPFWDRVAAALPLARGWRR